MRGLPLKRHLFTLVLHVSLTTQLSYSQEGRKQCLSRLKIRHNPYNYQSILLCGMPFHYSNLNICYDIINSFGVTAEDIIE